MPKQPGTPTRRYKTKVKAVHDLYKLEVASMQKNVAIDDQEPNYIPVEHCHFFHSLDQNGVPLDKCSPIGGHFHMMELVTPATDEAPAVYRCGKPMKMVGQGRNKPDIMVPFTGSYRDPNTGDLRAGDEHTHAITYIESHDLEPMKVNMAAQKFVNETVKKEADLSRE